MVDIILFFLKRVINNKIVTIIPPYKYILELISTILYILLSLNKSDIDNTKKLNILLPNILEIAIL